MWTGSLLLVVVLLSACGGFARPLTAHVAKGTAVGAVVSVTGQAAALVRDLRDEVRVEGVADDKAVGDALAKIANQKMEFKAIISHLLMDEARLNTTIQLHATTHEGLLGKVSDAIANKRRARDDHDRRQRECESTQQSLHASIDVVTGALDTLESAMQQDAGDASLNASLVQVQHTVRALSGELADAMATMRNKDAANDTISRLVALLNSTRSDAEVALHESVTQCAWEEAMLSKRLGNLTVQMDALLRAAAVANDNVAQLSTELQHLQLNVRLMEGAVHDLDHHAAILEDSLQRRKSMRALLDDKAHAVAAKLQFAMAGNHSRSAASVASALCLDTNGVACSGHGNCSAGVCECTTGYAGDHCELELRCALPPLFASGRPVPDSLFSCDGNAVGAKCHIHCGERGVNASTAAAQGRLLTCGPTGQWNHPAPLCPPVECRVEDIPLPEHARVACSGTLPGDSCTFECNAGTVHIAPPATPTPVPCPSLPSPPPLPPLGVVCTPRGQWEGTSDVCRPVLCAEVPSIENGAVECSGYAYGDVCKYSCEEGYHMQGDGVMRCLSNSSWSLSALPRCNKMTCPPPTPVQHGQIECEGLAVGQTCTTVCDDNYHPVGDTRRECLPTGAWGGEAFPACKPLSCGPAPVARNGYSHCEGGGVVGASGVGGVCEYTCETDDGEAGTVLTCKAPGHWDGPTNQCAIDKCALPPPFPHGHVTCHEMVRTHATRLSRDGDRVATRCELSCDDGFVLEGEHEVWCDAEDGVWDLSARCRARTCAPLPPVAHGTVLCTGNTAGHQCRVFCHSGFRPRLNATLTCGHDSQWQSTGQGEEACEPVSCGATPTDHCTGSKFGDVCSVRCPHAHALRGEDEFVCGPEGKWLGGGVCEAANCPSLSPPAHASLSCDGTGPGSVCRSECEAGYTPRGGSSVRTCAPGGVWSGSELACGVTMCAAMPVVSFGRWECSPPSSQGVFPHLSLCSISCAKGRRARGGEWVCVDGEWMPNGHVTSQPSCDVPVCGAPPAIANGAAVCSEGRCAVRCMDGFKIAGSESSIACNQHGEWETNGVRCVAIECGVPPAALSPALVQCAPPFKSSAAKTTTVMGGVARTIAGTSCAYVCSSSDVHTLVCGADGNWAPEIGEAFPPCATQCGSPPAPQNGSITCERQGHCKVQCNDGFTLSGASTLTCAGEGKWSAPVAKCVPVTCSADPVAPQHGSVVCRGNTHGSECLFACDSGFALEGPHTATCTRHGTWSASASLPSPAAPRCVVRECPPPSGPAVVSRCSVVDQRYQCKAWCDEGHVLHGNEDYKCGGDGRWLGSPVTECKKVGCKELTAHVDHGSLVCSGHAFHDSCELTCDEGFERVGARTHTCGLSGAWSDGDVGRCVLGGWSRA